MNSGQSAPRPLRGVHVLMALLAFFGFVILANIAFAIAAVRTFPGEDAPRSYLQGLHYNDTLAQRRAQRALGWRAGAEFVSDGEGAWVRLRLRDRDGEAVHGASVDAQLQRPADAAHDHTLAFAETGDGVYEAHVAIERGVWRLRGRASRGKDAALDFEAELIWPTPRS